MLNRIRNLCKNRNLKIAELERNLGFSAGLISRWSKSSPSIENVAKVADYFGVSIDWLYGRGDTEIFLDNIKALPESILFDLSAEEYSELKKYIDYIKHKRSF